ncbi:MAG: AraC family transcriptional regulator [Capsulimonadaceae bacterium]|nr:AraC family transcriptional regulator [Capsulimonadaceae bacterium]
MCTIDAFTNLLAGDVSIQLTGRPTIHHCAPDWFWKPPPLVDYDLWCVLAGRGWFSLPSGLQLLAAGSCYVVPPGASPHAWHQPDTPLTVFAVHFEVEGKFVAPKGIAGRQVSDASFLHALAERAETAYASENPIRRRQAEALIREIMLLLLVESQLAENTSGDERVGELLAAIRAEPGRRWSIDEMASRACLSRSQLTRVVTQATGMPPMEFVIRERLDRARRMLIETRKTITEIASTLGYEDVHYLSRQFKARYGHGPRAYRERAM